MNSKVSVIIPTYNRALTLLRAIESVQKQSFKDWQLIVIDDGSTDETSQVLDKIKEPKLKVLKIKTNQGVSHARNIGIRECQTQWVSFLDSDDEWLSTKLKMQFDLLEKETDLNIIHSDEIWIRHGVRVNPMNKHQKKGGDLFFDAIELCCISPSTVLLKKSIFDEVGLFREDFPVCEDYDLWLKITLRYKVGYVDQPLIKKYGGHDDQLSRQYKAMDYWRCLSLYDLLKKNELPQDKIKEVQRSIIARAKILLGGYRKHQNLENYDEIFKMLKELSD